AFRSPGLQDNMLDIADWPGTSEIALEQNTIDGRLHLIRHINHVELTILVKGSGCVGRDPRNWPFDEHVEIALRNAEERSDLHDRHIPGTSKPDRFLDLILAQLLDGCAL